MNTNSLVRYFKNFLRPFLKKYIKYRFKKNIKEELLKEAKIKFKQDYVSETYIKDYIDSLEKQYVSYDEYFHQYNFPELNQEERNKFISRAQGRFIYYDIPWDVKENFWDKEKFLVRFSTYIHREWIRVRNCNKEDFANFINRHDVICKPMSSCCGDGIYKIKKGSIPKCDLDNKYIELFDSDALLEQAISNGGGMENIHPESLNTIRVVTVRNIKTGERKVFGAFFRMGRGSSPIDNAHAGGLFAQINPDSGIIESEAISTNGERYQNHPDTGVKILGFQIPRWNEIKTICENAADIIPENYITGWDVVINQNEQIEIIEGNHGPDWDVMQSPLKIGVKHKLAKALGKKIV